MRKILFPVTNRAHLARNQILLNTLKETFDVHLAEYGQKDMSMSEIAVDITPKFQRALDVIKPDMVLIRADRFELLPCAVLSAYGGYKIAQLEAGDLSGVIDNKVRFAISHLSDAHFTTNEDSQKRMLSMGFKNVWNFGSLDVEYALQCPKIDPGRTKPYIVVLYHQIPGEDAGNVKNGIDRFVHETPYDVVGIRGNSDYTASKGEEYPPEQFINLLRHASVVVGNSSAGIKEAPALGCRVVNIGSRQANRLKPENVVDCKCDELDIYQAMKYQMGRKFLKSTLYYQPNTSKNISSKIREVII